MMKGLYVDSRFDRRIGQHDVDVVNRQGRQQLGVGAFAADNSVRIFQLQRGLDQFVGHELRHHVGDADGEPRQTPLRPSL